MSDASVEPVSADKLTPGQQVAQDVRTVIDHCREGRVTQREATELKGASERAIADHAAARAIAR